MTVNGGAVRATYVAELGSADGVYLCRAVCSRCVPEWKGTTHRAARGVRGMLEARDDARREVLEHVDRFHDGKLTGR